MANIQGFLAITLACLVHAQCLPLNSSDDLDSLKLNIYFNTTTILYNGTDVTKPMTLTNVQMAVYSVVKSQLSATDAAEALQKRTTFLPDAISQTAYNPKGNDLRLVYFFDETKRVTIGPKRPTDTFYVLDTKVWARQ